MEDLSHLLLEHAKRNLPVEGRTLRHTHLGLPDSPKALTWSRGD
jgi:hypothetical protein